MSSTRGSPTPSSSRGASEALRDLPHRALHLEDEGFDLKAYFSAAGSGPRGYRLLPQYGQPHLRPGLVAQARGQPCRGRCRPGGLHGVLRSAAASRPAEPGLPQPAYPVQRVHHPAGALPCRAADDFVQRQDGRSRVRAWRARLEPPRPGPGPADCPSSGATAAATNPSGGREAIRSGKARRSNILVADNQTDYYEDASISEKRVLFNLAWGDNVRGRAAIDAMPRVPRQLAAQIGSGASPAR